MLFLAGMPCFRADGAELVYDPQVRFELAKKPVLRDEVRMLGGYLEAYSPPAGTMSQSGGWTAVYDILEFEATPAYKQAAEIPMVNTVLGQVAITRPAASPDYDVRMSFKPTRSEELVEASISCSDSPIAALKNWEMKWICRGTGEEMSYTNREQGMVAADHFSVTSRGNTDRFEIKRPLTCLWTLLDTVRRLPARTGWAQEFDMYMDLSSLRRNQTLSFAGRGPVALATGAQEMNFYEQTGEGIEPIHYAVDQQQRTLFITQGQLGWGLNRIEEM
jgi:hypothetical protein